MDQLTSAICQCKQQGYIIVVVQKISNIDSRYELEWYTINIIGPATVQYSDSPNNGHFKYSTQVSIVYLRYVLYWGVVVKPLPTQSKLMYY